MHAPMVDLCFFAESDLDEFIQLNPRLGQMSVFTDDTGAFHLLFRCSNPPPGRQITYNGERVIGYCRPFSELNSLFIEAQLQTTGLN
jgi:hypothetical protein